MADDPADLLAHYRRLTARQQTLVRYLADATSRAEIAEALGISLSLVDKETAEVMRAFDLQEEGLTRAQRCVELRRMYLQLRRQERSEAAVVSVTPASGEPVTAPPELASSAGQECAATAEPSAPLVLLPPPIPTPPASSSPWRWWPLLAAVVMLVIILGVWRVTHGSGQTALAGATAGSTTESTMAGVVAVPVTTPTVAPAPTMTPVPPSPTPVATASPVPTATATVHPAATPLDLAGKVDSTLPGTPLQLGSVVTSVVDESTKPRDVYALDLPAGQRLQVTVTGTSWDYSVTLGAQAALPGAAGASAGNLLCNTTLACTHAVPIAAAGHYLLVVQAFGPAVRYTLHTAILPLAVSPDVVDLAGKVASALPGTPLRLGTTVTSVLDVATKRRDVYTLLLSAGQTLQVDTDANRWDYTVTLLPPGATSIVGASGGTLLCATDQSCHHTATIATAGSYTLVVEAIGPGVQYTLRATAR